MMKSPGTPAIPVTDLAGLQPRATAWELNAERPHLLALARRLTLNSHDANDLVQDAIVRALPVLDKITTGSHLRAWLLTIVRRMHIDRVRRVAREPKTIAIDEVRETLADEAPAGDLADTLNADDIRAALRSVPESFRQVLVLHDLEGRSYREIAGMLGVPLATVGTRLLRARLKLRHALVVRQATTASSRRPLSAPSAPRTSPVSQVGRNRPPADRPLRAACTCLLPDMQERPHRGCTAERT